VDWSPRPDYRLQRQDRVFILATRKGLGRVLNRNRAGYPPPSAQPPQSIESGPV
jgi:hypothetical protein